MVFVFAATKNQIDKTTSVDVDETKESVSDRVVSILLSFFGKDSIDELGVAELDLVNILEALTAFVAHASLSLDGVTSDTAAALKCMEASLSSEFSTFQHLEKVFSQALVDATAEQCQRVALCREAKKVGKACEEYVLAPPVLETTPSTACHDESTTVAAPAMASYMASATKAKADATAASLVEDVVFSLLFFFGKTSMEKLDTKARALVETMKDITTYLVQVYEKNERSARKMVEKFERTQEQLAKRHAIRKEMEGMVTAMLDCVARARGTRVLVEVELYICAAAAEASNAVVLVINDGEKGVNDEVDTDCELSDTDTSSGGSSTGDHAISSCLVPTAHGQEDQGDQDSSEDRGDQDSSEDRGDQDDRDEAPIDAGGDPDVSVAVAKQHLMAVKDPLLSVGQEDEATRFELLEELLPEAQNVLVTLMVAQAQAMVSSLADPRGERIGSTCLSVYEDVVEECMQLLTDMKDYLAWASKKLGRSNPLVAFDSCEQSKNAVGDV